MKTKQKTLAQKCVFENRILIPVLCFIIWGFFIGLMYCVVSKSGKESKAPESQKGSLFNEDFMHYRIGDVFRFPAGSFHGGHKHATKSGYLLDGKTKALELNEFHLKHYPDSLASKYLKKKTKPSADFEAMEDVLNKSCPLILKTTKLDDNFQDKRYSFKAEKVDSADTVVMHARLGDTANDKNVTSILEKTRKLDLGPMVNKVIIICGMHFGTKEQEIKSKKILEEIRGVFYSKGVKSIVISNTPDEDACVLSKGKTVFIPKRSGFSDAVLGHNQKHVIRG